MTDIVTLLMEKNKHVHVKSLKRPAAAQAGHISPLITTTYSVDAGITGEMGILASSDRCLLNADEARGPLQVARRLAQFQLVGYIDECFWSMHQLF